MKPVGGLIPFSTSPPCGNRCGDSDCDVALCRHVMNLAEAIHLVSLGARAGLVRQLTGLEKAPVNRLYRQLCGTPSPPGQMPFSDAWYRESDLRMLHATLVWRLHRQLMPTGRSAARVLIDVFETYIQLVREPLLDLTHTVFVARLVAMATWEERRCRFCDLAYLAPVDSHTKVCPGCRMYHRYRCRQCGSPLETHARGRRRLFCTHCVSMKKRGLHH